MSFVRRETYTQDPQILIFADGNHATNNVTITDEFIASAQDGSKTIPAGMFVVKINDIVRYLPRSKVKAAVATTTNEIPVTVVAPYKSGEQIYKIADNGTATLVGTIASINIKDSKIVLTANAAVALAIGDRVGAQTIQEYYGLDPFSREFNKVPRMNIPCFKISTGVKEAALPYMDEEIRTKLNLLNFQIKF